MICLPELLSCGDELIERQKSNFVILHENPYENHCAAVCETGSPEK